MCDVLGVLNNRLMLIDPVHWSEDGWPYIINNSPSIGPNDFTPIWKFLQM